jgi:hypothetical protein
MAEIGDNITHARGSIAIGNQLGTSRVMFKVSDVPEMQVVEEHLRDFNMSASRMNTERQPSQQQI